MKKRSFFLLLFIMLSCTITSFAQQFSTNVDSLVATFEIKNKKAVQVHPKTTSAKAFAQKNTADLIFILDHFFTNDQYHNTGPLKVTQYQVTANLLNEGIVADSFLSVVYLLEIPDTLSDKKQIQTGTFQKVKSRPTKVPEQFYLSRLPDGRLMLVAVVSYLYKDEAAALKRKEHIHAYLAWLYHKY
ncbi:hypothetical protein [Chryseobacterium sp. G0186]|uniref:hypothetical protein n=1 Tax=Chryseobacterium sp. G0186 TaxID=2487064 RepID=UPI000F4FDD4C|nr:hypothetical protein [Chryseobacterium sp. G0186]